MAVLLKKYRLKQTFAAPNILAVRGKRLSTKVFHQGQEVIGEVYEGKNKTIMESCILVQDNYLIPLHLLELAQEISTMNYTGKMPEGIAEVSISERNKMKDAKNYTVGMFTGAAVGFFVAFYCAHKGWIQPSLRNKVLIIAGGGILGGYVANKK